MLLHRRWVALAGLVLTAGTSTVVDAQRAPLPTRAARQQYADQFAATANAYAALMRRFATDDQFAAELQSLAAKGDLIKVGDLFSRTLGISRSQLTVTREGTAGGGADELQTIDRRNELNEGASIESVEQPLEPSAVPSRRAATPTLVSPKTEFGLDVVKICIAGICTSIVISCEWCNEWLK